jgi:hypothetical protein
MIVVTISMWPRGDQSKTTVIGSAEIINCGGSASDALGDYKFEMRGGVHGRPEITGRLWKRGFVKGFPRKRRGAWDLLYLTLKTALGNRV